MFNFLLQLSPWFLVISAFLAALAFLPGMMVGVVIAFILYVIGIPASIGEPIGIFFMFLFGILASGFTFWLCFGLFGCALHSFKH